MFTIRRMRPEDVDKVAKLEAEVFSDPWSERSLNETLAQKQTLLLAAFEDKELIGYIILYYVLEEGEIARIAVAPDHRRKGVASKIFLETQNVCRDYGINRILLEVREGNEPARNFYESYGFEVDGIRKNYYTNPSEHAVLMSRKIGESMEQ